MEKVFGGLNLLVGLVAGAFSIIAGIYLVIDRRAKGQLLSAADAGPAIVPPAHDAAADGQVPRVHRIWPSELALLRSIAKVDAEPPALALSASMVILGMFVGGLLAGSIADAVSAALILGSPVAGITVYSITKVRVLRRKLLAIGDGRYGEPHLPLELALRVEYEAARSAGSLALLVGAVASTVGVCAISAAISAVIEVNTGLSVCTAFVGSVFFAGLLYPWLRRSMLARKRNESTRPT